MSIRWMAGHTHNEYEDLPSHLLWAATMHARRLLDLGTPESTAEIFDQAVSIGVSIELLIKSTLAGVSFHLLAADTDHTTTLTLSGIATSATGAFPPIKTLGAEAALKRLNDVTPKEFGITKGRLLDLLSIRNSAMHMGLTSAKANQDALPHLITLTGWVFKARAKLHQPGDENTYWGPDRIDHINKIRNTARGQSQRELDQLLHRARRVYQDLQERVDYRSDVIAQFANTAPNLGDSEESRAEVCPACGNQAWVVDRVERGAPQREIDHDDVPGPAYVERWGMAQYLKCGACQLMIRDTDLLELSGIPIEVELDPDDATQQEIDNQEQAAVEAYLEQRLGQ